MRHMYSSIVLNKYSFYILGNCISILAEFDEVEYKEMLRREMKEDALIEAREVREEAIQAIIETCRELGCSDSDIVSRLETKFSLKSEDARGYLNKF